LICDILELAGSRQLLARLFSKTPEFPKRNIQRHMFPTKWVLGIPSWLKYELKWKHTLRHVKSKSFIVALQKITELRKGAAEIKNTSVFFITFSSPFKTLLHPTRDEMYLILSNSSRNDMGT
jgi:hypothetical protein